MPARLTDAAVRALAPRAERYEVQEPGGLGVRVSPTGRRTWQLIYHHEGAKRRLSLGEYPAVTLAEARRRAAEARALVSEGIDPAARRRQEAEARRAEERAHELRPTLGDFWLREYRPRAAASYAPRTLSLWDGLWRRHLLPTLGDVRLHEITRRHCVLAIDAAESAGPSAAAKAQRLLQAVLRSAVDRGILDASPAERLPTRSETAPRDRALSDAEIVELWIGLD